jgi:hypothetical protein
MIMTETLLRFSPVAMVNPGLPASHVIPEWATHPSHAAFDSQTQVLRRKLHIVFVQGLRSVL